MHEWRARFCARNFRDIEACLFSVLATLCISIVLTLKNRLRQTGFRNSTGNTLFRAYFNFRPQG